MHVLCRCLSRTLLWSDNGSPNPKTTPNPNPNPNPTPNPNSNPDPNPNPDPDQESAEPAAGYNDEWLAGVIDQLSEFDRDMNTVVVDSGILTGIPSGALMRAGECSA